MQTTRFVVSGLVAVFFVVPLFRGALQGWLERDPWAPFATRADGRNGVLAPGRYFAALRAPRVAARTTAKLAVRWLFWVAVTLVMVAAALDSVLSASAGSS